MDKLLLIDQGNTRAKFACYEPKLQKLIKIDIDDLASVDYQQVYIAAVGDYQGTLKVLKPDCNIQHITTPERHSKLTLAYREPCKMGVDRWLAMLAIVTEQKSPAIVVDCGTALTIDIVNDNAEHIGGFILPGFSTSRSVLMQETQGIKLSSSELVSVSLGANTDECINNGIIFSHISLIEKLYKEHSVQQKNLKIVLTGGDGQQYFTFLNQLDLPVEWQPELVFHGMLAAIDA